MRYTANNKSYPPLSDQSFWLRSLVGASFCNSAVQNQPLMRRGCRSSRLQPLKSHRRPEVQIYFTLSTRETFHFVILCFCFHKYRLNLQNHAYLEWCGSWWTRSRRKFPTKPGPYNVVGRSFYLTANLPPVQLSSDQPMRSNSLFHWIVDECFLRKTVIRRWSKSDRQ